MKKWSWLCPIEGCTALGKKGVRRCNALHYGKWHIIRSHGLQHVDPIIVESMTPQGLYDYDAQNVHRYIENNASVLHRCKTRTSTGLVHRCTDAQKCIDTKHDAASMQNTMQHRCICIDAASDKKNFGGQ